jgi:hypothetical protein
MRTSPERKGQSPFYPGQPVPAELFVGREREIVRIQRAASQVAGGKPQSIYIAGEYGIGKSSLARYVRVSTEADPRLLGVHVLLGTADTLEDVAFAVVQNLVESHTSTTENIRAFLAKYVGEQSLFGISVRLDALKRDAQDIARNFLPYLRSVYRAVSHDYKGLLLILDEINGLARKPFFGHFLKEVVDSNALSSSPLPLLLILCGTDQRRLEIIQQHRPVERIFEVAAVDPMTDQESREFFTRAFARVNMQVEEKALARLCQYSGGFPKLMHLIGDAAFWIAEGNTVTEASALDAALLAAEEVGRKFFDQQVYKAVRSDNYRKILLKLAESNLSLSFNKKEIEKGLSQDEKRNFHNFLQRMKKLNVLTSGKQRGEYEFTDWLTRIYLSMLAAKKTR